MLYDMPQCLSNLLGTSHFLDQRPLPDLLQPTHAYLGGILRRVQCPGITIGGTADQVHAFFQLAHIQKVAKVVEILKSSSSQWLKSQGIPAFAWQRGFLRWVILGNPLRSLSKGTKDLRLGCLSYQSAPFPNPTGS